MPSTYDSLLRLELQAVGENRSTWGTKINNNLELIAEAIAGHVSVNVAGSGDYALITVEASTDEARNMFITLNGTLTGARNIFVPQSSKEWYFRNNTSGNYDITVRTSVGTGLVIANTGISNVVCDGVSVYAGAETNRVNKAGDVMTGTLSLPSGTSVSASQAMRSDEITLRINALLAAALPSGVICGWSGTVSTVPSGWALCDGTNGTPDMRDRFIIAAGATYTALTIGGSVSVNTGAGGDHAHGGLTGGTSLSVGQLPSHTHAVSLTDPGHTHAIAPTSVYAAVGAGFGAPAGGVFSIQTETITTASTGILVTVAPVGSGATHDHAITSSGTHTHVVSVLPPYFALAFIMKL